jgi:hypothetical protein
MIKILPRNLDECTSEAIIKGESNSIEVLANIAENFPDTIFYREIDGVHYTAEEIKICYSKNIDPRARW